jgi:hypothetical protein
LVALLSWGQVLAILGIGPERFDETIRFKEHPLSPIHLALLLTATFLLNVLPYLFELARAIANRPRGGEHKGQVAS